MSQIIKASILSLIFGLTVYSGILLNVFEVEGDGHSHSHSETAEHTEQPSANEPNKQQEESHTHSQSETVEHTESHTHDEHDNSDGHSH